MTIILPSMGRSGSTALFYSLLACIPPHAGRFVPRLAETEIVDGEIIKTHDFAPDVLPDNWKVIYTYGNFDKIERSASKHPQEWLEAHLYHLGIDELTEDNLKANYNSWKKHDRVLFIHFDQLFESADIISKYLGIDIVLPKRIK